MNNQELIIIANTIGEVRKQTIDDIIKLVEDSFHEFGDTTTKDDILNKIKTYE